MCKVDAKRLCDAAEDMKTQLEGKLFTVVANDEDGAQLDECFREARGILDTTGDLLGWPHVLRERSVKVSRRNSPLHAQA